MTIAELETTLKEARAAKRIAVAELAAGREKVSGLESALARAETDGKSLALELADARTARKNQARELAGLREKLTEEQAANRTVLAELEARRAGAADLESALAKIRNEKETAESALNASRAQIAELEQLRSAYQDQKVELARLESALSQARNVEQTLLARLAARDDESGAQPSSRIHLAQAPSAVERVSSQRMRTSPTVIAALTPERETARRPDAAALQEVEGLVSAWARAWSRQAVADYLAFYSADFRPADGSSRKRWERKRRQRLTRPAFIQVEIADLKIEALSPRRARATFRQAYRADRYQDQVIKTLELSRSDGGWKISREASR